MREVGALVSQYIQPDIIALWRKDAVVYIEIRSSSAGVVVDSASFGDGRGIPALGDAVRLPPKEGSWGQASFSPPGRGDTSLTDPSDLIIAGHAGRRVVTDEGMPGTVSGWGEDGVDADMDDGSRASLRPFSHAERGWTLLTMTAMCRRCRRPVSIYTPELVCGACVEE
jgi:hypothetical protein